MNEQELKSKRWKISLKAWAKRRTQIQKAVRSGKTMTAVGEEFGISRQRVEQICKMQPPWEE